MSRDDSSTKERRKGQRQKESARTLTGDMRRNLLLEFLHCCHLCSLVTDRSNQPPNPCSQWLSQESWDNITQLERLPRFLSITVSFDENSRLWEDWYLTLEPEKRPLPGVWRNVCSGFHMLLLIRCLRLDRLTSCMAQLISDTIGNSFLEYPNIAIDEIFRDSTPNKPLVLFTASRDTNPEKIIEKLAVNLEVRFRAISLGKGQENAASQLIIDSAKMGYWVFISKCHLLLHWLPALEKFVSKLQAIKVHEKFRLWLGSAQKAFSYIHFAKQYSCNA
ncbi:dynein heavy chain 2, axonemal [Caerostris extrusa]|uniref:Dynein heavy chain 2, axonemal n=1 Tax=Caerostris extrusa TaxID=172846 RepID=A0AAV4Y7E8_CAEEX|nr:dynein heavy chain 2, axonemal [Caerostris extrusa]